MLFNSYVFVLAFFPIVLLGYFGLNHFKKYNLAKIFLVVVSLFFYGYFNWRFLFIIVFSVILNYAFSRVMLDEKNGDIIRKIVFAIALLVNIGSLFYFKYYDFFISIINDVCGTSVPLLRLMLPLGISFFTFQQVSYVIDSYKRDKGVAQYKFLDYTLFVTYFPQLIAGPIVTHDEMVPQFADNKKKKINYENFAVGLYAFVFGLAKKVLIADRFGLLVDAAFSNVANLGTIGSFLCMLAYTFQIYFDFSGYCDMATGIGKMMNINITMNFNSPYKSINIVDFWKRWHITLTRFFTKYVYIPLGGNRKGGVRTYVNIMLVFLISGIWHGANWTFIVWGLLHGFANVITKLFQKKTSELSVKNQKTVHFASWIVTFVFINITWVIFRAESLSQAVMVIGELFNFNGFERGIELMGTMYTGIYKAVGLFLPHANTIVPLGLFAFAMFASVCMKNIYERINLFKPTYTKIILTVGMFVWCIMSFSGVSSFLYWNF